MALSDLDLDLALDLDLRELPLAGGAIGVAGDLLATGGDTILTVAVFLVESLDLWLPFLSRLTEVADIVSWLPRGAIEPLVTWVTVVFVVVYGLRIGQRIIESVRG